MPGLHKTQPLPISAGKQRESCDRSRGRSVWTVVWWRPEPRSDPDMRDFQQSSAHSGGRLHGQLYRVLGLSAFQLNMIRSGEIAVIYFTISSIITVETQILHFLHAEIEADLWWPGWQGAQRVVQCSRYWDVLVNHNQCLHYRYLSMLYPHI